MNWKLILIGGVVMYAVMFALGFITAGLIGAFIVAGIYGHVRSTFTGHGWQRGLKFGFVIFLIVVSVLLGMSGVFNLPDKVWLWWSVDSLIGYVIGGAALGWVADKVAPRAA
jgi:hypothetical protein